MPDLTSSATDIWASYLENDEKNLWQGRPSGAFHMRRGDGWNIFGGILAMLMTGFMARAAFSPGSANADGPIAFKVIFGAIILLVFLVGLYMASFQFYFAAVRRGKTRYAITNKRALALTQGRKEKFESDPLNAATNLDYVPGDFASIYYKKIAKREVNRRSSNHTGPGPKTRKTTYSTKYTFKGFELIPDGTVAYQTMLGVIGAKLANPDAATKKGEAWQDFLFEGETLLWEGAPFTGPRPTRAGIFFSLFGLIVMAISGPIALRVLTSEFGGTEALIFGGVAALVFMLGLALVAGIWLIDMRMRKATRYALTNKRAFVAKAFGGRNMLTYAIKPLYRPLLLKGWLDEVTFGEEDWFDRKTGAKTKRAISFNYLKDGEEVYDILTKVSKEIDAEAEAQK